MKIKFLLVLFCCLTISYTKFVCSEDELVRELLEDIDDNGQLDCLRENTVFDELKETKSQRIRRLAAQWDSDCSFEADNNKENGWFTTMSNRLGLSTLVDVNGDTVKDGKDFVDQADMCEIIRALVADGKLEGVTNDLFNIPKTMVEQIDCAGEEGSSEICALTGSSFTDEKGWYILLEGHAVTFADKPEFVDENEQSA